MDLSLAAYVHASVRPDAHESDARFAFVPSLADSLTAAAILPSVTP